MRFNCDRRALLVAAGTSAITKSLSGLPGLHFPGPSVHTLSVKPELAKIRLLVVPILWFSPSPLSRLAGMASSAGDPSALFQYSSGLDEQAAVDGLVRHAHLSRIYSR